MKTVSPPADLKMNLSQSVTVSHGRSAKCPLLTMVSSFYHEYAFDQLDGRASLGWSNLSNELEAQSVDVWSQCAEQSYALWSNRATMSVCR